MQFDLTQYVSLLEAFDQTGRRIFRADWQGDEVCARDATDPAPSIERRKEITNELLQIQRDLRPEEHIAGMLGADDAEKARASRVCHDLRMRDRKLSEELLVLPQTDGSMTRDFQAFQRRCRVEKELFAAFDKEQLRITTGDTGLVQWKSWKANRELRVWFWLSLVRIPSSHAGRSRRRPALVFKADLERWLNRFGAQERDDSILTPAAQCEDWLHIRMKIYRPKEHSKGDYRELAIKHIPNLSVREFNRIWDNVVPDSWHKGGRPMKYSDQKPLQ